eukprot:TRINITY_DN371_c0_g1_i5.p1 TRINITY_DN371_c0_g1~~TRINITY_DN371_c0_g1_i5.p1  ORF type:complete len:222 (-),score=21.77 TRINITY_DN371_c0_g1_i5:78-743(-)
MIPANPQIATADPLFPPPPGAVPLVGATVAQVELEQNYSAAAKRHRVQGNIITAIEMQSIISKKLKVEASHAAQAGAGVPAWAAPLLQMPANLNALSANVNALTANLNALSADVNALTAAMTARHHNSFIRNYHSGCNLSSRLQPLTVENPPALPGPGPNPVGTPPPAIGPLFPFPATKEAVNALTGNELNALGQHYNHPFAPGAPILQRRSFFFTWIGCH